MPVGVLSAHAPERGERGGGKEREATERRGGEACALSNKRLVIARPLCEDDSSSAETENRERDREREGLRIKGRDREREREAGKGRL
jgi:hypothetical protein